MEAQSKRSVLRANLFGAVLAVTILVMAATNTTVAKSLYLLSDGTADPPIVQAYSIAADGSLTFQAQYTIRQHGLGAVDLAIDSFSGYLFVVYRGSNVIQVIDARTMTDEGTAVVPGTINLASIVYDHNNRAIYCVDRGINRLYAYDWDASTKTLTRIPGSPFTYAGPGAYGIALDEAHDQLYAANHTNTIAVYNTSDWSPAGTVSITPLAASVAVDATNGLLYSGAGFLNNHPLTQYDLVAHAERAVTVEPDARAIGIAVDPATGFVYVSTGRDSLPGGDNLVVFDKSLTQIDPVPVEGNPAALLVSSESFGHNPLNLSKSIAGEIGCVDINDIITYDICFDNSDNDQTVNNVSIVDILPEEVDFVTADGDGVFGLYDLNTHTYTWSCPSLQPGASDCLRLVVQVNQDPDPNNATITNSVTITADHTPPTTASVDVVKCGHEPVQADLRIVKVSLVPRKRLNDIMVIVKLPQGVNTSDIQDEPLILDPGNTEASYQHVYAAGSRAKVIALFQGAGLLDAVPGYGPVEVKVTGRLKSGRPFYGQGTIVLSRLLGPRLR